MQVVVHSHPAKAVENIESGHPGPGMLTGE